LRYLFLVTKAYSVSILNPLQKAVHKRGAGEVRWYVSSFPGSDTIPVKRLKTTAEVVAYDPHAVIVPGNIVPHFWPGLKVQIFHGLGEEKRGHYRITGFFDLYCTPGPHMTSIFERLAREHGHFLVQETGWPKLDSLGISKQADSIETFGYDPQTPVILYAPTFSPRYSSARILYEAIQQLSQKPWQWLVKFHPLMEKKVMADYQALQGDRFKVVEAADILPALQAADILITDTSSVAYEYLLLDRPIITFRATTRRDKGIDLLHPYELPGAIQRSLENPGEYSSNRQYYVQQLHPYRDGRSSHRVLESIQTTLESKAYERLQPKPRNWLRKWQLRRLFP